MPKYKFSSLYKSNRKEYYRRARISASLIAYHETGIKKSERDKVRKAEIVEEEAPPSRRTRKQIVLNIDPQYNISVRVVVVNGQQSKLDLKRIMNRFLKAQPHLKRLMEDTDDITEGFEDEAIDDYEDENLREGKIYIESNIRGKVKLY